MSAVQAVTQNLNSIRIGALLLVTTLVVFWRLVIKIMIMILVVAVLTGLVIGALVLLQSTHHLIG